MHVIYSTNIKFSEKKSEKKFDKRGEKYSNDNLIFRWQDWTKELVYEYEEVGRLVHIHSLADLVPCEMAYVASSLGRMSRTDVWISRDEMVDFLE